MFQQRTRKKADETQSAAALSRRLNVPNPTHSPAWANALPLQRKLTINQPGDVYEQEADRVAEEVMRMPAPGIQRCGCGGIGGEDGECPACKVKRLGLQRKGGDGAHSEAPPSVHQTLVHGGQPLDTDTRDFMESRFGADFSDVRVHTDAQAAQSASEVSAKAYTVADNIVFAKGEYITSTDEGRSLIAHELTHVIQQSVSSGSSQMSTLQRYVSPLDVLDYLMIAYDVGERIYLTHFYEGDDREFQLFLNALFLALDVFMAAIPGGGGGGAAARLSRGALVHAWAGLPAGIQVEVIEQISRAISKDKIRVWELVAHMMSAGGRSGGSNSGDDSGSGKSADSSQDTSRTGRSHPEQRAEWKALAQKSFKSREIKSTGKVDKLTGKLVYSNQARKAKDLFYYTIDEWHGQIEIFDSALKHVGAEDIVRGVSLPAVANRYLLF